LVARNEKVVLRKVDLTQGGAAAEQAAKEFNVEGIPHLRVFDGKGAPAGTIVGGDIAAIEAAVAKALASGK
jgi:thiol:disulfide interchange protein